MALPNHRDPDTHDSFAGQIRQTTHERRIDGIGVTEQSKQQRLRVANVGGKRSGQACCTH